VIFIVHASLDARGQIRGVITLAQTGRKEQFAGAARLGDLIAAMAGSQQDGAQAALNGLEKDGENG